MAKIQVFLDTDVVISALLSRKGASFEIVTDTKIKKVVSKAVKEELDKVTKRKAIIKRKSVEQKLKVISLGLTKEKTREDFSPYVFDEKDSHVVAGAQKSKSKFLLTHNTKHYKSEKIKKDLDILVMKPGGFLQYLRSKK